MALLDILPLELLDLIAGDSEHAYHALVHAYPRFARSVTAGKRIDFAVSFGHDYRVQYNSLTGVNTVWLRHGVAHRMDGPARVSKYDERWSRSGMQHRDVGPSMVSNGYLTYTRNGLYHREGGPAIVHIDRIGVSMMSYYVDGKLHRHDGPAIVSNRYSHWLYNEAIHRDEYPAFMIYGGQPWTHDCAFEYHTRGSHMRESDGLSGVTFAGDILFAEHRPDVIYHTISAYGEFIGRNDRWSP